MMCGLRDLSLIRSASYRLEAGRYLRRYAMMMIMMMWVITAMLSDIGAAGQHLDRQHQSEYNPDLFSSHNAPTSGERGGRLGAGMGPAVGGGGGAGAVGGAVGGAGGCIDQDGWCTSLGDRRPMSKCYKKSIQNRCCATCERLRDRALPDCPFGDKEAWCSQIGDFYQLSSCYENSEVCCDTCSRLELDIPGCSYGDSFVWCSGLQTCSIDEAKMCCKSCYHIKHQQPYNPQPVDRAPTNPPPPWRINITDSPTSATQRSTSIPGYNQHNHWSPSRSDSSSGANQNNPHKHRHGHTQDGGGGSMVLPPVGGGGANGRSGGSASTLAPRLGRISPYEMIQKAVQSRTHRVVGGNVGYNDTVPYIAGLPPPSNRGESDAPNRVGEGGAGSRNTNNDRPRDRGTSSRNNNPRGREQQPPRRHQRPHQREHTSTSSVLSDSSTRAPPPRRGPNRGKTSRQDRTRPQERENSRTGSQRSSTASPRDQDGYNNRQDPSSQEQRPPYMDNSPSSRYDGRGDVRLGGGGNSNNRQDYDPARPVGLETNITPTRVDEDSESDWGDDMDDWEGSAVMISDSDMYDNDDSRWYHYNSDSDDRRGDDRRRYDDGVIIDNPAVNQGDIVVAAVDGDIQVYHPDDFPSSEATVSRPNHFIIYFILSILSVSTVCYLFTTTHTCTHHT